MQALEPSLTALLYILGPILLVSALLGIVQGTFKPRRVWRAITREFGIHASDSFGDQSRPEKIGDLLIHDCRFMGVLSIGERGVQFERPTLRRREWLLFPWAKIDSFSINEKNSKAEFRVHLPTGLFFVEIPWSSSLTEEYKLFSRS